MKTKILSILLLLLCLTGCMELPEEETTFLYIPPTEPITTTTEPVTTTEIPMQEEYNVDRYFRLTSYSAGQDDLGNFHHFGQFGAETMELKLEQFYTRNGILEAGPLLFADGYPQPYSVPQAEEMKYLHSLPRLDSFAGETLTLVPIRGQAGEMVELVWFNILEPDVFPTSLEEAVLLHTNDSQGSTTRIALSADPSPVEMPPSKYAISNSHCTYAPTTTDGNVVWDFTINGEIGGFLEGISDKTPLKIQVECQGMAGAEMTVVVFVDDEPVEGIWEVTLQNEQKTCLTGELLLPDFDGTAVVYAVLVPRNTTDPAFDYISFYPQITPTFWLVDELA